MPSPARFRRAPLIEVGAGHRLDEPEEVAQDAVFIKVGHGVETRRDLVDASLCSLLTIALVRRVKTYLEQRDELLGDARVAGQRLLHVSLREWHLRLTQVLAARAQHDHLAPGQPRAQHQAIEAVVLDVAAPDPGEGVLELVLNALEIDGAGVRVTQPEVVHPHPGPARALDLRRVLILDPQPHVLEHGQGIGQRNRPAGAKQLEVQLVVGGLERPVQAHRKRVRLFAQALQPGHVLHGDTRVVLLAIMRPECVAVAAHQHAPAFFAEVIEQRIGQPVTPLTRQVGHLRLELLVIDFELNPRVHAQLEVKPRQHRFRELYGEFAVVALSVSISRSWIDNGSAC